MPITNNRLPYTCARCLRASRKRHGSPLQRHSWRGLSRLSRSQSAQNDEKIDQQDRTDIHTIPIQHGEKEQGAMSRRLSEATEEVLFEGGRAGRQAIENSGFSEELKERLLEKVAAAGFRSENVQAFAEVEMSAKVGRGSRDIVTAHGWTGEEEIKDSVLRMLDDARKPLKPGMRGPAKIPRPIVDLRLKPKIKERPGQRLANARDKTSVYSISKDMQMTDEEREHMRRDLKERFTPGARAMPNSIRGLAALANERIENAIARGQFKNIPRGKGIERDARADNPFIDTTEYIMNKMIQRQDIVPPWIEKQQELVKTARVFRERLRHDWKRHAARTISSRGGSLQHQIQTADLYADAEKAHNPKQRAVEQLSVPTNATRDVVMIKIIKEAPPIQVQPTTQMYLSGTRIAMSVPMEAPPEQAAHSMPPTALPPPFRIPTWEAAEMSYLTLAITNLNSITRSYNLMAPDLAKKPYFSLQRELKSCYADVAPQLSDEIRQRAMRPPKELVEKIGHRVGGIMERFATDNAKVYDSKKPSYGFKELWKDLWSAKEN